MFAFRLAFGLSQPFFSTDELQTYLIGLKCYSTGTWPYFGPDLFWLEKNFESQIPGALEGLLTGLPFHLWAIPEAPFILLNLLSMGALGFLAWYITKRVPEIPFAFTLVWLSFLPWNLHISANTINTSYLLFGSIPFFIGFLEATPELTIGLFSPKFAFAWMGFGLFWNMQFHYSWILLPPFIVLAILLRWRRGKMKWAPETEGFILGSFFPLVFLIPTWIRYGIHQEAGGMGLAVGFNRENFLAFFTVLARYFSIVSFEIPKSLGANTHFRLLFLENAPWLILPAVFLLLAGWLQPLVLFLYLCVNMNIRLLTRGMDRWFKDDRHPEARPAVWAAFFGFFLAWAAFWFNAKGTSATSFYILMPLLAVYSFYAWARLSRKALWRWAGIACLAASLWFQGGYLMEMMRTQSLYLNRPLVQKAISEKNYKLLGERRPGSRY